MPEQAPQPHPGPDPTLIFETFNAHQKSAALRAGIELNLFTAIAEGAQTAEALAVRCQTNRRATRILCDFLVVAGFLSKNDGRYVLEPVSAAFLDRNQPGYLGDASRFINSPDLLNAFRDVAELVRRGTTLNQGAGSVEPEWDGWVDFARGMAPMMAPPAEFMGQFCAAKISGPAKVLDIAAGHGLFGIAVARHNPLAEIVPLDWAKVLAVASENAAKAGVESRYHPMPGDALALDYGSGFDIVLVANFFHHFDKPTCESLMRKIHAALNPGGFVATLEFVPNEDRVSPPGAAIFSMMMLGTTPSGDAYTFAEYEQMFQSAGFERSELVELPAGAQRLVVSHR